MFGSNNFSVKKLAAFSAVLSIILMSCGGSSTSSNAGRSKNATLVNGVCVWDADEEQELSDAHQARATVYFEVEGEVNALRDDPPHALDDYLEMIFRALGPDQMQWTVDQADAVTKLSERLGKEDQENYLKKYESFQPRLTAADAAYANVENGLKASTAVDCAVKDEKQEEYDNAVAVACSETSNDNQQIDEADCEAAVTTLTEEFREETGDYPAAETPDIVESLNSSGSTFADVTSVSTWEGRTVKVLLVVPPDLLSTNYKLDEIVCEGNSDFAMDDEGSIFKASFISGGSCSYLIRKIGSVLTSEKKYVSINNVTIDNDEGSIDNDGGETTDPGSAFDQSVSLAAISINVSWNDNTATVELVFPDDIADKFRFGLATTGVEACPNRVPTDQWTYIVTPNDGDSCEFSVYEYATDTIGEWVTVMKDSAPTTDVVTEPAQDVVEQPYLSDIVYGQNGEAATEVVVPLSADMENVFISISDLTEGLVGYFRENPKSAFVEFSPGGFGSFALYRGDTLLDRKDFRFQKPASVEEKYSIEAEVDGNTLIMYVLDKGGIIVPKSLYHLDAPDFVGGPETNVSYDQITKKHTVTGLVSGSEFGLVLFQKFDGNWTEVARKTIKIPGKVKAPALVVPPSVAQVVAVVEAINELPLLVNQLTSQVVSEDQTDIACDQTCVSAILATVDGELATVDGEIFAQIDGGKEVQLDGTSTVKINSDSKIVKILVKPIDGSAVTEYGVALSRNTSSDGGPGSTSNANSSSMNWVYILIAILLLVIFGIVKQRRNPVDVR